MRALHCLLAAVVTTLAVPGCTETQYEPNPTSDGYGPAHAGSSSGGGGGGVTSSSSTSSGGGGSGGTGSGGSGGGSSGGGSSGGAGSGSSSGGWSSGSSSGSGGTSSGGSSSGAWPPGDDAGTDDDGGTRASDGGTVYADGGSGVSGAALLALCVNQINEFRNQNQEVPLSESSDLEQYAAAASASDAHSGNAHRYFDSTNGGGVADTEDELDGARFDPGATAEQTMEQGLIDDEEDNGNAAGNLLDERFTQVGCGFAQDLGGNWWIDIALR